MYARPRIEKISDCCLRLCGGTTRYRACEELYTVDDIQHILKVSRTTVYELLKSKKFYSVRVGGQYRISKKSFENWLNGEKGGSEDGIC